MTKLKSITASAQQGITLMEVMLSVAIIAMMSTMIWAGFAQINKSKKIVEASLDRYHQVIIAFEKITSDLSMAHLSKNLSPQKSSITSQQGFIGRNSDPDELHFTTFSHMRRFLDAKEGDRCEVSYTVEQDREEPEILNLVRRESTYVDDDTTTGGKKTILLRDIVDFNLEYYDITMDKWEKEWDTTQATGMQGRLPYQIRIYIVIHDEKGEEVEFATQVPLDIQTAIVFRGR